MDFILFYFEKAALKPAFPTLLPFYSLPKTKGLFLLLLQLLSPTFSAPPPPPPPLVLHWLWASPWAMAAPNIEMIAASLRSCSLGGGGGGDQSPPRPPPPHLAEATDESAGGITVELNSDTALPYHWEQCLDMRVRSPSPVLASLNAPLPLKNGNEVEREIYRSLCLLFSFSVPFGAYLVTTFLGCLVDSSSVQFCSAFLRKTVPKIRFFTSTGEIYYINRETGVRTTEDPRTAAASSSAYSSSYYRDGDGTSDEYSCSRVGSEEDDYEEEEEEDGGDTAASSTLSCTSPPESSANEEPGGQILVAAGCKACFMYFMVPKRVDACPKCGGGLLHLGRNGCV
ncbi:hypothetical protein MUK42_33516 [Musa troglodytarum]|uniref:Uncharacterized protein n=1 Tax=Musa troglodytarum TaxID=320322 RepID=A0A9E7I8J3_9LILI|nr:hypothetical protein MUK42_33516 [Musa troglodytarum]